MLSVSKPPQLSRSIRVGIGGHNSCIFVEPFLTFLQ
jgi:hypothetical protein